MERKRDVESLQRENEDLRTKLNLQRELLQVFSNYELSLGIAPQPTQPVQIRAEKLQFDPTQFVSYADHKKVVQELEFLKKVVHVQSLEVELLNARFAQLTDFVKESFKPEINFSSMPIEVRQQILSFVGLDLKTILRLGLVSKTWARSLLQAAAEIELNFSLFGNRDEVTDESFTWFVRQIPPSVNLKVDLSYCNGVTGQCLMALSKCHNLTGLHLLECAQIDYLALNCLTRLSGIRALSLPLDAEDLNCVTHLTGLTALDISSCNTMKPKKLASISTFPNLAILKLPAFTTDATMQHVKKCTNLEELDMSLCEHISEAGVKQLTGDMSSLCSLKLTGNYLNKEILLTDYIKLISTALVNLEELSLSNFYYKTNSRNEFKVHLKQFSKLTNLRALTITDNYFDNNALKLLAPHLANIQSLSINCPNTTDLGLGCLSVLVNLQQLNLHRVVETTKKGFKVLTTQLPSVTVSTAH